MRKNLLLLALIFVFAGSLVYAQETTGEYAKLKGIIIDTSAVENHRADIADFVKEHPLGYAPNPGVNSDALYSIYTDDGRLLDFDEASSDLISEFLTRLGSTTQVEVEIQQTDYSGDLSLVKIRNQG